MMLVLHTQYMENYGAHGWDGKGECPQHWKMKGGAVYKITDIDPTFDMQDVIDIVGIEHSDNYSREYILGHTLEADDYLSDFEKSQLEYEGEIIHPEPRSSWDDIVDQVLNSPSVEIVWNRNFVKESV